MIAATPLWVSAVELIVGLGCLAAAAGAMGRRMRIVALLLLVAGLAAALHAVAAIVLEA
jgi:hypothetical protein